MNAFADLLAANDEYARDFSLGDLALGATRKLAVVTCMDSRLDPLPSLGLEPGDAFVLRNGGARVTDDVVRSLALARGLGVERVMLVAHTGCRAVPEAEQEEVMRADLERLRADESLAGLDVGGFRYAIESGRLSRLL